jgi:hypothetical protein
MKSLNSVWKIGGSSTASNHPHKQYILGRAAAESSGLRWVLRPSQKKTFHLRMTVIRYSKNDWGKINIIEIISPTTKALR